ncbi:MAG: OmpW family protein, partial [Aquabacterium sp.]|nr:OmpW family protein [Aquabacterium sp.]
MNAAALAVAALAPVAAQAAEGPFQVRVRAVNLEPANKDDVSITDVTLNSKIIPEVDFTYFVTPNIAAELVLTVPQKHDVS